MGKTYSDKERRNNEHKLHKVKKHNKGQANSQFIREWTNDVPVAVIDLDDFEYKDDKEGS